MTIESDVGIVGAGKGVHANRALTEVRTYKVGGRTFTHKGNFDVVEIGVVEIPEVLVVKREMETEDAVAALNA